MFVLSVAILCLELALLGPTTMLVSATFTAARVVYPMLYAMRVGHPRTAAFAVAWIVQLVLAGGLVWHVLSR